MPQGLDPVQSPLLSQLVAMGEIPQYRRTYVQGCACTTGIAGGACCPSHATSASAGIGQQLSHASSGRASMWGLNGAGTLLGGVGLVAGVKVMRDAWRATGALNPVFEHHKAHRDAFAILLARTSHVPASKTKALGAWAQHGHDAHQRMMTVLRKSRVEQLFNALVPGFLQAAASSCVLAAWAGHMAGSKHNSWLGLMPTPASFGVASAALFALYAGVLATKAFAHAWADNTRLKSQRPYASDVRTMLEARRQENIKLCAAWSLSAATALLGLAMGVGACTAPPATLIVPTLLIAASLVVWAQNARTRFVPHVPISHHVEPRLLVDERLRREAVQALSLQDAAIKDFIGAHTSKMSFARRWLLVWERAMRPQCGASAFRVLPHAWTTSAIHQHNVQPHVVKVLMAWVDAELMLTCTRHLATSAQYEKAGIDLFELEHVEAGPHPRKRSTNLTMALVNAVRGPLALQKHAVSELKTRRDILFTLKDDLGVLSRSSARQLRDDTEIKQRWLQARFACLLLSGTLADALDVKHAHKKMPEAFFGLPQSDALPIANVAARVGWLEDILKVLSPSFDEAFLHAFFNPRRLEAELDYLAEFAAEDFDWSRPAPHEEVEQHQGRLRPVPMGAMQTCCSGC